MERKNQMGKKVLAMILIFGLGFWAGYYVGQRPLEEVKKQLQELSQKVVKQTIGLGNEELLVQNNVLRALSGFVNGKAKILDGKSDEALAEMEKTLDYLKEAVKMKGAESSDALIETMSNIDDLRQSLADGEAVSQEALEDVQAKLEALLLEK